MAYAIVKTGGKQYRVEQGQTLLVERLPEDEGATGLKKVSVKAKIVRHERGEKLRVFKFKPKRGYKRTAGHRQELTRLEITELSLAAGGRQSASARGAAGGPAKVTASAAAGRDKPASEPVEATT